MPAMGLKRLSAAVGVYAAHPGPREAVANTVALVIVSNQPFYPLYLHWAVSPVIGPSLLTFLSTPLFAMVPAVMRRSCCWPAHPPCRWAPPPSPIPARPSACCTN